MIQGGGPQGDCCLQEGTSEMHRFQSCCWCDAMTDDTAGIHKGSVASLDKEVGKSIAEILKEEVCRCV